MRNYKGISEKGFSLPYGDKTRIIQKKETRFRVCCAAVRYNPKTPFFILTSLPDILFPIFFSYLHIDCNLFQHFC